MQVASLVLGIIGLVMVWIPIVGMIPAVIGLILGIVSVKAAKKAQQESGLGTAGLVLSIIAIVGGLITLAGVFFLAEEIEDTSKSRLEIFEGPVADGVLKFTTQAFACGQSVDGVANCDLFFTIEVNAGASQDLTFSHTHQSLVTVDATDSDPDRVESASLPIDGSCPSEQLRAGNIITCRATFSLPDESSAEYAIYKADQNSVGVRVLLPAPQEPVPAR